MQGQGFCCACTSAGAFITRAQPSYELITIGADTTANALAHVLLCSTMNPGYAGESCRQRCCLHTRVRWLLQRSIILWAAILTGHFAALCRPQ